MKSDQMSHDANQREPKRARVSPPSHQDGIRLCEGFAGMNENQMQNVHADAVDGERGRIDKNGQLVGVKDGWVVFVVHPTQGRRVVKEGIVLVDDERIVCGGSCQGFFASPVPDDVKAQIHMNDSLPPTTDKVLFPNLFMLAPAIRQMAADVAEICKAGIGEVTHPHEVPGDDFLPPGVDAKVVAQVYRAAFATASRGEVPEPPEVPSDGSLPPGADARVVAQVYRAAVATAVKDVASGSGDALTR